MTGALYEVAIRRPKKDTARFIKSKNAAVKKLISIDGIGPEREFMQFSGLPTNETAYVGMTMYRNKRAYNRALFSVGFFIKLMGLMKNMDLRAGVILSSLDEFDYQEFCNKGNVVEFALHKIPKVKDIKAFKTARATYLASMNKEHDVLGTYTFEAKTGLKLKNSFVHFIVYKDKSSFELINENRSKTNHYQKFTDAHPVNYASYAEVVK